MITSLLREELLDFPATVTGDSAVDGPLLALVRGEPRLAIGLLDAQPATRTTAALRSWAELLDRNWYPGDVGAEIGLSPGVHLVEPSPSSDAVELLVELSAADGDAALLNIRTVIESAQRQGAAGVVAQSLAAGDAGLRRLSAYGEAVGRPEITSWAFLAGADLRHRAGRPESTDLLARARERATAASDVPRLARTHLVEGDWAAAPGSSPLTMGWDLAPENVPSPLGVPDLTAAAESWRRAESLVDGLELPRLRGALALRQSVLAAVRGDGASRRELLGASADFAHQAGDTAAAQLVAVHSVIADIDDGLLGVHQLHLGGGWNPPTQGPIAEVLEWTRTRGSRSWCIGLGRLLQRCGDGWARAGSMPRARVAYVAALQLMDTDPAMHVGQVHSAIADVEVRLNLSTNALLRLERVFAPRFALTGPDDIDFAEKVEASMVMTQGFRSTTRGAFAARSAALMQSLRDGLGTAVDACDARLGPAQGPVPTTVDELQALLVEDAAQAMDPSAREASLTRNLDLMARWQLRTAREQLALLDVLIALAHATSAELAGSRGDAERWHVEAVDRAGRSGVEPYLLPVALQQAGHREQAAAAMAAAGALIPDELQLSLWLRVGDPAAAGATWDRLTAAGRSFDDWVSSLTLAELHASRGEPAEARSAALAGIRAFEESIAGVLRDPDRLDACDQPDVAALYSTLARAELALGDESAAFDAAESVRRLVSVERNPLADVERWTAWQRAAAEYAAVSRTVLAAVSSAADVDALFAMLDEADGRLMRAEQALDAAVPGVLLARAVPSEGRSVVDIRSTMPDDMALLAYLVVGDDLLAWAVTRDRIVAAPASLDGGDLAALVRTVHTGCAQGHAPAAEVRRLADLLIVPFADVLRDRSRVAVVPFDSLHLVPFHALPLDGEPLGATHVVSYCVTAEGAVADRPAAMSRPLVVGDPAFDPAVHPGLMSLPGSRIEAVAVAAILGHADLLLGDAATESAVAAKLEQCDLLHVASHGHLDELSPFASSLVMAGADELTVAELVGLRFTTDLAVFTGCDTGRGAATLGADVVGLTRALLRGGVRCAVVSLWPVDDAVVPVVMSRFYSGLAAGSSPAAALADAQRAVRGQDAPSLRAAYESLDGQGSQAGGRRGVEIDPELSDDAEVAPELGGDAERYWAPFVLITSG